MTISQWKSKDSYPGRLKQFIPGSEHQHLLWIRTSWISGIDSKELIQLVNIFETEIGIELYPTLFFEYPNIASLARFFGTEHGDEWRRYFGKDFSRKIENTNRSDTASSIP